jgi:hypothetical protein
VAAVAIDVAQNVGLRRMDFAKGHKFVTSRKELDRRFKQGERRF